MRKFHHRYYDVVDNATQEGFQNTFSVTALEAGAAKTILNSGKILATSNQLMESIFFGLWEKPNFREKSTNEEIKDWPVYGWNYDVLIGGLYPDQRPEWEFGLNGYTLELAVPVTQANALLKRVRAMFDEEAKAGRPMTATYRSGINVKFGRPYEDLLGQVHKGGSDGGDWSKGAIMFDFPSFRPTIGDHKRYNEDFCKNIESEVLTDTVLTHWFRRSPSGVDPDRRVPVQTALDEEHQRSLPTSCEEDGARGK